MLIPIIHNLKGPEIDFWRQASENFYAYDRKGAVLTAIKLKYGRLAPAFNLTCHG